MFYDILPDGTTDPEAYQDKLNQYRHDEALRLQLVHWQENDWNLKQRQAAADEYARRQLLALRDSSI